MSGPAHTAADLSDARLTSWYPPAGSADSDYLPESAIITSRARDLSRNNGIASGVNQTYSDNIIGATLRLAADPQYRLLGKDKKWASKWATNVEDLFATWADTPECDTKRSQNLLGLTTQALKGAKTNGDAIGLIMWQPRRGSKWATRLRVIESDRLATPPWLLTDTTVRGGVKVDQYGAPAGYWILKRHPGDNTFPISVAAQDQWELVPAFTPWGRRRVIHLFDKERAGQSRGKSIFAAVIRDFKVSGDYMGSELQAAAANALIATLIESDLPPETIAEIFGAGMAQNGTSGDPVIDATQYWGEVTKSIHRKKVEGGMMVTLPLATKASGFNPNRPNTAFDGFMESIMRHISAGLNLPYELVMKDFSKTNYSSARASLLEAWRYFYTQRRWVRDEWLDLVYEAWLEEAVDKGLVKAPGYYDNRYSYTRCRWVFSGRGWVDPVKEAKAAQLRMDSGLSTLEQECAEQGLDWEEVLEQRARERTKMEELGLLQPYELAAATPYVDTTDPNAPAGTANG